MSIEQQVTRLIVKGKSNAEIAEAVRAKNRGAKTSPGSVAWYRSKMKRTASAKPIKRSH